MHNNYKARRPSQCKSNLFNPESVKSAYSKFVYCAYDLSTPVDHTSIPQIKVNL